MPRGGKGGKGPKPTFTRVIPKFLQQYETMLTGPKPRSEGPDGEQVFSGAGGFTDEGGGSAGASSGMPGRARRRDGDSNQGGGASGGGGPAHDSGGGAGGRGGAFGDYDEEEVAALEAYMETHPSKEEDREALRKRAKELSASIGSGEDSGSKEVDRSAGAEMADGVGSAGISEKPATLEEPIEYTDASGRLKFNKRPVAAGTVGKGDADRKRTKKMSKRSKLAKLNNAKLLSFGDDEDG